jgi:hypothetical protein
MLLFLLLGNMGIFCLQSCASEENQLTKESVPANNKGKWLEQGLNVHLKKVKEVKLDTAGDGFMISLTGLVHRNDRYYAIGGTIPEIIVYDSTGAYLKTIRVNPSPSSLCSYRDITMSASGALFIKDIQSSEILEVDLNGDVRRRFATSSSDSNQIAYGGLEIVETPTQEMIFSTIFQWLDPSEILIKTLMVGQFDQDGKLTRRFANHDPLYDEYNLIQFQPSTFTSHENKLYLLEEALPFIRVYSLSGELISRFGEYGMHQRPLRKMPTNISPEEQYNRSFNYTRYDDVKIVSKVLNQNAAVLVVTYNNLEPSEENMKRSVGLQSESYLMVYSLEGELLVNDLPLPGFGYLLDVNENSDLIILLNLESENRLIGHFRLAVESSESANTSTL